MKKKQATIYIIDNSQGWGVSSQDLELPYKVSIVEHLYETIFDLNYKFNDYDLTFIKNGNEIDTLDLEQSYYDFIIDVKLYGE
jgi:hypothetical protein